MSRPIPGGAWNDETTELALAAHPPPSVEALHDKLSGGPTWEGMQLDMVLSIFDKLLDSVIHFRSTRARLVRLRFLFSDAAPALAALATSENFALLFASEDPSSPSAEWRHLLMRTMKVRAPISLIPLWRAPSVVTSGASTADGETVQLWWSRAAPYYWASVFYVLESRVSREEAERIVTIVLKQNLVAADTKNRRTPFDLLNQSPDLEAWYTARNNQFVGVSSTPPPEFSLSTVQPTPAPKFKFTSDRPQPAPVEEKPAPKFKFESDPPFVHEPTEEKRRGLRQLLAKIKADPLWRTTRENVCVGDVLYLRDDYGEANHLRRVDDVLARNLIRSGDSYLMPGDWNGGWFIVFPEQGGMYQSNPRYDDSRRYRHTKDLKLRAGDPVPR